jgi:hypothetical protein
MQNRKIRREKIMQRGKLSVEMREHVWFLLFCFDLPPLNAGAGACKPCPAGTYSASAGKEGYSKGCPGIEGESLREERERNGCWSCEA